MPWRLWLALALIGALAPAARADLEFQLTLNNPALLNSNTFGGGGPYAFDFTLVGGVNTNTASMSGFNLGGGSADSSTIFRTGGASGDINTGSVVVTDNASQGGGGFNDFNEVFTPILLNATVTFDVDLTTSFVGGTPDRFTFSILDTNGNPISTNDPNAGENALVGVTIDHNSLQLSQIETYSSTDNPLLSATVNAGTTATPEPSTFVSASIAGLFALGYAWRRKRRSKAAIARRDPPSTDSGPVGSF